MKKKRKLDKKIITNKNTWTFKSKSVAENFDEHVQKSVPFYEHSHKLAVGISEFFLKDNSICCDLGCSTGSLLNKIRKQNKDKKIKYYGYDSSSNMIKLAKRNKNIIFKKSDLNKLKLPQSDFILSLFTIQFIEPKNRQKLFDKIFNSLNWGGGFFLCEKIRGSDARFQDILNFLYFDFKKDQKLSNTEILNKEQSLRGVMEPFTINENVNFLKRAGFKDIMPVYQYLCFKGFLAIK